MIHKIGWEAGRAQLIGLSRTNPQTFVFVYFTCMPMTIWFLAPLRSHIHLILYHLVNGVHCREHFYVVVRGAKQ